MIYLNENPIEFITFPNKEKRLDLPKEFVKSHDSDVVNDVYWKYETDESIFELLLLDNAIKSYNQEYNLYIGYMPYSRMDRVKDQGTAFSLEVIAHIINNLSETVSNVMDNYIQTNKSKYNRQTNEQMESLLENDHTSFFKKFYYTKEELFKERKRFKKYKIIYDAIKNETEYASFLKNLPEDVLDSIIQQIK